MIIQNSAINIAFPRIEDIKKRYILNEHIIKKSFNEAIVLPIPDDAPVEFPRIIVKTKGEHSQLTIAQEAVNFQTAYTDKYMSNWKLCEEYVNERMNSIFDLIDSFADKTYSYIGIVANLVWDEIKSDGNKVLFHNLFGKTAGDNLDDLEVKYTYVENEKYYVNITLRSVHIYEALDRQESGGYADENLRSHTISITLDINDRYSFNKKKGYKSSKEVFSELMVLTTSIMDQKLQELVGEGVY